MSNVVLEITDSSTVVDTQVVDVILELTGTPGPAGASGSATIVQESEPTSGSEGDLWFNPVTKVLKVYTGGVWIEESQDDGFY